jgi:hypothetical protein
VRANRVVQQTRDRPEVAPVVRAVRERVGPKAPIGLVGGEYTMDYPFFGRRLDRRIVRFDEPNDVTIERMRREGLKAVLFAAVGPPPSRLPAKRVTQEDYYLVEMPAAG